MKKTLLVAFIVVALVLTSCSSTVELTPEERESLIQGSVFTPQDNVKIEYQPYEVIKYVYPEESKIVTKDTTLISSSDPDQLLDDKIEENTVSIETASDFRNGIVEYNFTDGRIYDVWTTPQHVTDIRLAPGETISGKAAIGDSEAWQLDTAVSSENGRSVTHIYVKPVTIGIETSMIVPTDQRTYYINLKSYENLHMVGVRWKYPGVFTFGASSADNSSSTSSSTTLTLNPENLNFDYKITGAKSIWRPTAVYDDGVHTYIQFDPRFNSAAGAPALYLLPSPNSSKNKVEVVNYVIQGNLYITDFVLQDKQTWYLMSDKTSVKIKRK